MQPASEIDAVLKLKEPVLPKQSHFRSIQFPKIVKSCLLQGSGQNTIKQGNYAPSSSSSSTRDGAGDPQPRSSMPRSSTTLEKEMESEVVLCVLVFHPSLVCRLNMIDTFVLQY